MFVSTLHAWKDSTNFCHLNLVHVECGTPCRDFRWETHLQWWNCPTLTNNDTETLKLYTTFVNIVFNTDHIISIWVCECVCVCYLCSAPCVCGVWLPVTWSSNSGCIVGLNYLEPETIHLVSPSASSLRPPSSSAPSTNHTKGKPTGHSVTLCSHSHCCFSVIWFLLPLNFQPNELTVMLHIPQRMEKPRSPRNTLISGGAATQPRFSIESH